MAKVIKAVMITAEQKKRLDTAEQIEQRRKAAFGKLMTLAKKCGEKNHAT